MKWYLILCGVRQQLICVVLWCWWSFQRMESIITNSDKEDRTRGLSSFSDCQCSHFYSYYFLTFEVDVSIGVNVQLLQNLLQLSFLQFLPQQCLHRLLHLILVDLSISIKVKLQKQEVIEIGWREDVFYFESSLPDWASMLQFSTDIVLASADWPGQRPIGALWVPACEPSLPSSSAPSAQRNLQNPSTHPLWRGSGQERNPSDDHVRFYAMLKFMLSKQKFTYLLKESFCTLLLIRF